MFLVVFPASVPQKLLDEGITLLFAGQDTTAATLSWTVHLIALHPDKQERTASEARFVLGRGVGTRYYTKNGYAAARLPR